MTERAYTYSAYLERQDGSFISLERIKKLLGIGEDPPQEDLTAEEIQALREIVESLTPAALTELRRYARDMVYEAGLRRAELQAALVVEI